MSFKLKGYGSAHLLDPFMQSELDLVAADFQRKGVWGFAPDLVAELFGLLEQRAQEALLVPPSRCRPPKDAHRSSIQTLPSACVRQVPKPPE